MHETDSDAIAAPEVLELIRRRSRQGMTQRQLVDWAADEHDLARSEARSELRPLLRQMIRDGVLVLGRGKRYFTVDATELVPGQLRMRMSGFGVVQPEARGVAPIRIEKSGLRGALDGDRVLVRLERPRARARAEQQAEGVVVRVLERARTSVVGRWVTGPGRPFVRPVDRKLGLKVMVTGSELEAEPADGDFVMVTLDQVSERAGTARGRLVERLGRAGDPGIAETVVLRTFAIDEEFPEDALAEAERLEAGVSGPDLQGRWDLRDRPAVTVDPESARDHDDAVSAEAGPGDAITVEVHIADVSHYVAEGTALDRAARDRSTSVYLPGRVVPMLPERLSADLCSLREKVERLAFTVRYEVRPDGTIGRRRARPSVIRSRRRCVYGEVAEWLDREPAAWPDDTAEFAESLRLCGEAARRLSEDRRRRGSLDFDLAEPRLVLDEAGEVVAVSASERTVAHRMIEELMVAANRCVAQILLERDQPALHRVHDRPDPKRLTDLAATLLDLGVEVDWDPERVGVAELQALLDDIAGEPSERLVSMLVLRSMPRAVYSPEARGHFALAADAYAHFTSPIRRYPDLVVHRMLRELVEGQGPLTGDAREAAEQRLVRLGEHCSAREQRAEAAERMAVQWRTMEFLADRVGEVAEGRVSGVTDFGLFVQLDEFAVDGLVHIGELVDDYYEHDPVSHSLVGSRTGRRWRLGDPIRVRMARIDLDTMQLQLIPVGVTPDRKAVERPDRRRRPKRPAPPRAGTRPPAKAKAPRRPPKGKGRRR